MADVEKINEFEIEAGETLHLKGVSAKVLREFVDQLGGLDYIIKHLNNVNGTEKEQQVSNRMFMYILGWGITNDVPQSAMDELELLGITTKSKRVCRAHWIRAMLEPGEGSQLVSQVFLLSIGDYGSGSI